MNNLRLVETRSCPVCAGVEREPSDGMARERGQNLQGRYYLKPVAAALEVSVEELDERVKTYRCLTCGNFFCDPWLSPELASSLFCANGPDHLFAWGSFESWLHRRPPVDVQARNEWLYATVVRKIGPIFSYAEFGCPFQGFLMHWKGYEAGPSQRLSLFSRALCRAPDVRWSRITWLYNAMQRWSGRLAVLNLKIRGALVRLAALKKALNQPGTVTERQSRHDDTCGSSFPRVRYLLTRDTTMGWGSNCVRFGASCRYFAHTVLGADVIPIDEAHRHGLARFDLIGIFNSLDHTTFPVEVICKSLERADHVLLVTHRATRAGKQHLFAFSDDFAAWLNRSLEGITAENLYAEEEPGSRENNYILLSRTNGGR